MEPSEQLQKDEIVTVNELTASLNEESEDEDQKADEIQSEDLVKSLSVGTKVKHLAFNQRFPPKDQTKMKHAVSDNHLNQQAEEWRENQVRLMMKKRKSMNQIAQMEIDHTVWIDTPMFATMGVSNAATGFYRNAKNQSMAQISRGEEPDQNLANVIDYYEQGSAITSTLLQNAIQGLFHSFMFGWSIGVLNVPQGDIEDEFGIGDGEFLWLNAVFALGCIPGSFMGGFLSDRWGRKSFLIFNDFIWIICGLGFYFFVNFSSYLAFRFVIGLAAGGASVVVPTFLGEISPVSVRGAMGTSVQLTLTTGILVSQFIAKWVDWKIIIAANSALAVVQLLTLWSFMESPAWLILKGRDDEAEATLQRLRHRQDVDFEMRILSSGVEKRATTIVNFEGPKMNQDNTSLNNNQPLLAFSDKHTPPQGPSFRQKLSQRVELRKALVIAMILLVNQQLSGINSVFFYSSSLFKQANVDPWLGTVLTSTANVFGVVLALALVENLGRKACLIASGFIMIAASACSIVGLDMNERHSTDLWRWFTIGASMLYVTGFELGFGPIPWTIAAELTPSAELSTVQGIASAANGLANFVIAVSFPHMQKFMGSYVYLPFIGIIMFTIVFVYLQVPETKGLRVEQVCQILRGTATENEVRERARKQTAGYEPI